MTSNAGVPEDAPEGGSFRDPSGYVFQRDGRVFRAIASSCHDLLRGLERDGTLPRLIERGAVVGTRFVEDPALRATLHAAHPAHEHFLEHDRIPFITFPYEWSVSMLADAGLHTLDLEEQLLDAGCALKDATAYNIQFVRGRPVFIDLGSFERPRRLDLWFALGQFNRMFLYPLMLAADQGWDLRSYFLANLQGRSVEEVARGLGWVARLRPRALLDVTLPLLLNRWAHGRTRVDRAFLERDNPDSRPQRANLARLRRKVRALAARHRPSGVWSDYARTCSYDAAADGTKRRLVGEFLAAHRPARVLDLGCNTGEYTWIACENGAEVIAVDQDHDAVEALYRRLRERPAPVTPMVLDITSPSPAIGHLNRERASLLERLDADCVLALALVHHLLISGNLSLQAICDLLHRLTKDLLVLEFVPPEDPMFRRMLQFRVDLFADVNAAACKSVFADRFTLLDEHPIPGTARTLLFLRRRALAS
jgi:SAM-dependent methyltransferase